MPTKKKTTKKKTTTTKKKDENKAYQDKPNETKFNFGETGLTVPGQNKARGFEDVDASDVIVPQLTLLQALSPLVQDFPEKYKPGMVVNGGTDLIMAKQLEVFYIQLIQFYKNRIKWIPKDEGGGISCMSLNSKTATQGDFSSENNGKGRFCANCPHPYWKEGLPPKCTLYYNFPCLFYGNFHEEDLDHIDPRESVPTLCWISFGKTNFIVGKKLLNGLRASNTDIFSKWIAINTRKVEAKGFKYFVFDAFVDKNVKGEVLIAGENGYKFLTAMKDKIKYGEDQQQETEYSDVEDNDEV